MIVGHCGNGSWWQANGSIGYKFNLHSQQEGSSRYHSDRIFKYHQSFVIRYIGICEVIETYNGLLL